MSATFSWVERNGRSPGSETIGTTDINWKAVDDVTTSYSSSNAIITAGTNSYTKWNYATFSNSYTTIANVTFSHYTGIFGPGLSLMCQKSMVVDGDQLVYATPTRAADNTGTTPYDLTTVGNLVTLFVGPTGPDSFGKSQVATNPGDGTSLYTNYIVTQLQTTTGALPGDTALITFRVQYDEA